MMDDVWMVVFVLQIVEHKRSECEEAPVQCTFHAVGCTTPVSV